jgi:ornithine cyclodeaminase
MQGFAINPEVPMPFTVVNAEQTQRLLPMNTCIALMQSAMMAASQGGADSPPRLITPLPGPPAWLALMPGASAELGCYGAKMVGLHPDNPKHGRPAVQGFVCLFNLDTGEPMGMVDGAAITAIRTAAASGLASRCLARPNARSCGIMGTGVQAISHVEAMLAVRDVQEVIIWGRDFSKASALAAQLNQQHRCVVRATAEAAEAAACDMVCTVTGSAEPVLKGEWVQPGAHINLVGAHSLTTREADSALISQAALYVDSMVSTRNEGGDIMIPLAEGTIDNGQIVGEIGALLNGDCAGRESDEAITVYNSLGITAQDIYAADYVLKRALGA